MMFILAVKEKMPYMVVMVTILFMEGIVLVALTEEMSCMGRPGMITFAVVAVTM